MQTTATLTGTRGEVAGAIVALLRSNPHFPAWAKRQTRKLKRSVELALAEICFPEDDTATGQVTFIATDADGKRTDGLQGAGDGVGWCIENDNAGNGVHFHAGADYATPFELYSN